MTTQYLKPSRKNTPPGKFADRGKWTEEKVQDWLKGHGGKHVNFAWHRLPDARSARGALSAQPADWMTSTLLPNGVVFPVLLEAKETTESRKLPKDKIGQYGKLYMFSLAGMSIRVVVYRSTTNDWTYFTELELFPMTSSTDDVPTSFSFAGRPTFATAAEALEEIYRV